MKRRRTKRAVDGGDSAAFSTPEQNPALGVLSTPAPPQLTQTVRQAIVLSNR